jgi:anti-sigma factor RsiW
MNHRTIELLLSPYLDDELTERERDEVAAHLRGCDSCRIRLEELRALRRQIQMAADIDLPDNFAYAVLRAARSEQENSLRWLGAERFARNVVIGLVVIVLCLIGLGTMMTAEPPLRVDRYLAAEATDSLTRQVLDQQIELSKDDVVYAAVTK